MAAMYKDDYYEICNLVRNHVRSLVQDNVRGKVTTYVNNSEDSLSIWCINEEKNFRFEYTVENYFYRIAHEDRVAERILDELIPQYKAAVLRAFFKEEKAWA